MERKDVLPRRTKELEHVGLSPARGVWPCCSLYLKLSFLHLFIWAILPCPLVFNQYILPSGSSPRQGLCLGTMFSLPVTTPAASVVTESMAIFLPDCKWEEYWLLVEHHVCLVHSGATYKTLWLASKLPATGTSKKGRTWYSKGCVLL